MSVTVYFRHMLAARAIYFPHGRQSSFPAPPLHGEISSSTENLTSACLPNQYEMLSGSVPVNANTQPALATSFGSSHHLDHPCSGVHVTIPMDLNNCPLCLCGQHSMQLTVRKEGPNMGRMFFKCSKPQGEQCNNSQWADLPLRVAELGATGGGPSPPIPGPPCTCGQSSVQLTVRKEGPNTGRLFYACARPQADPARCNYFQGADEVPSVSMPGGSIGGASVTGPSCACGQPSVQLTVRKEGPNLGRLFYACALSGVQRCKFF